MEASNGRQLIKLGVGSPILLKPLISTVVEAVVNQSRFSGCMNLKSVMANCRCTSDKLLIFHCKFSQGLQSFVADCISL